MDWIQVKLLIGLPVAKQNLKIKGVVCAAKKKALRTKLEIYDDSIVSHSEKRLEQKENQTKQNIEICLESLGIIVGFLCIERGRRIKQFLRSYVRLNLRHPFIIRELKQRCF